jgi:hypothetical protein
MMTCLKEDKGEERGRVGDVSNSPAGDMNL